MAALSSPRASPSTARCGDGDTSATVGVAVASVSSSGARLSAGATTITTTARINAAATVEGRRLGLPCPPVPDDHVAGAVLLGRDDALEVAVFHRMVLDVPGEALVRRVEAGPFRHGPAHQDAAELQAKVVVKAAGCVFLDDVEPLFHGSAGVAARLEVWEGMIHAWHLYAAALEDGRRAVAELAAFVRSHTKD